MKTARRNKITDAQIGKHAAAKLMGNSSCRTCACLYATARSDEPPIQKRDEYRWVMTAKQVLHCASGMFEPILTGDTGWSADRTKVKAPDNRCVHYHPTTSKGLDIITEETGSFIARNNDSIPARIRRVIEAKGLFYYKAASIREKAK